MKSPISSFSKIIQDSYFMANENGAKAASATAVKFGFFRSAKKPKYLLNLI